MARNNGAALATTGREIVKARHSNGDSNKIRPEDRPAHEWYRFVLSYPPHLVRDYLERFGVVSGQVVLDPFSGTGTTPVECKKQGVESIGVEANPMSFFASSVKLDWSPDPDGLIEHARHVADRALGHLCLEGIEDHPALIDANIKKNGRLKLRTLDEERLKLLLTNSISPLPLHKALVLMDAIEGEWDERFYRHERLAFAKSLVANSSNLHFGPEVGVSPPKPDAPVVMPWLQTVEAMAADLRTLRPLNHIPARVYHADARNFGAYIDGRVDAVITSPPYPNEKDYTRTTRLEAVLLGFASTMADIRAYKRNSVRSNTRGVYKDDTDDQWIDGHPEVERIAREIEGRRIELGKTSGFEKLYARVTKLYFGGMKRHLAELRTVLRPGAQLAYVVGDQASYLRVMIRTGQLLADIAEELGYEVTSIDLFRTRLATATKEQLREEVVVLRWPER